MTREDIVSKLAAILPVVKPKLPAFPEKDWDAIVPGRDLLFDSLDSIALLFQVEEIFAIKVPDDDADTVLASLGTLTDYILARSGDR